MKFRTGLVIGAAIGMAVAARISRPDPDVVVGPRNEAPAGGPAFRAISRQGRRLADRATWQATELISRARAGIQQRLGERGIDEETWDTDPTWN